MLSDTAFGHAWAAHLVLAAALVAVVAFGPRARWAATSLVSAALLASLGLVGHAAMQTGAEGVLHRANHAVHLLAAGAWIGGLVPFAMCLRAYERDDLRKDAVRAMTGFSFWGQFIVAAIVLTGVVNIALTSGHPPIPPTTPYRALLVAKLIIVAIMIALALLNRYVLAPRLKSSANALADLTRDERGGNRARLRRRRSRQRVCAARPGVKRQAPAAARARTFVYMPGAQGSTIGNNPYCAASVCSPQNLGFA